ncbi:MULTISPECIES: hypothetical protein [Methylobacterium]|uniref:hypothetical protein n=1 Tax=Methylobacterium TaxID=407 RepID=UPI00272EBA26|nr:hypothetical protein [Methylobacterium sp.]
MNAAISRYLPEFPAAPAGGPSTLPETFDDPWAGLARAPRRAAAPSGTDRSDIPVTDLCVADLRVAEALLREVVQPAPRPAAPPAPPHPAAEAFAPIRFAPLRPEEPAGEDRPAALKAPVAGEPRRDSRRETPEERAALLAAAEERGRQQGLAEAREEAEIARRQADEAAEIRLEAARRHWSQAEAEALADGFSAALRALDATLSDRIARLLAPVLTDALRRQAVAELSGALSRLLGQPQAANVRVSGPEDLLAALATRLGPLADTVSFTPAETAEVQVSADQTVIDTQLGAWTRLIAAAVAEI